MKALRTSLLLPVLVCLPLFGEQENIRARLGDMLKEETKKASEGQKKPEAEATPAKTTAAPSSKEEASKTAQASNPKDGKVVDLPQLRVEGRKVPRETLTTYEAKVTVVEYDKKIEREMKHTTPSNLDNKLNPDTYSVLGNRSAAINAEEAKLRVQEMEVKQSIAAVATDPTNDEENKKLLEMLKDLEYRKNKDADPGKKK